MSQSDISTALDELSNLEDHPTVESDCNSLVW